MSVRETRDLITFLLALFVILVIAVMLGWALDWISFPARVISPDRMVTLSRQANDHYQSLEASLGSIQVQRKTTEAYLELYGEDYSTWPQGKRDEYQQNQRQLQNLINAYNQSCAQYKALWLDEWRDVVAPNDLPTTCETIQ